MKLFETPGADKSYDEWLETPAEHIEDGCEKCHRRHVEDQNFEIDCLLCKLEKCQTCHGNGYIFINGSEEECQKCEATGRVN